MEWSPTLPAVPGLTAITFTVFWPPFHGTTVLGHVCANSRPLLFIRRWPYLNTRPCEPERPDGSCRSVVETTCPVAGGRGTSTDPVTLPPCELALPRTPGLALSGGPA